MTTMVECERCGAEVAMTVRAARAHRAECKPRFEVSESARMEELQRRVTRAAELLHDASEELVGVAELLK